MKFSTQTAFLLLAAFFAPGLPSGLAQETAADKPASDDIVVTLTLEETRRELLVQMHDAIGKLIELEEGKSSESTTGQSDAARNALVFRSIKNLVDDGAYARILRRSLVNQSRFDFPLVARNVNLDSPKLRDTHWHFLKRIVDQNKEPSPFWIGVQCEPSGKTELQLEEDRTVSIDGGLLITQVVEDGPAEEAGLKVDDVLIFFGADRVNAPIDLVGLINKAESNPVKVSVVRDCQLSEIVLTPAKRKPEGVNVQPRAGEEGANGQAELDDNDSATAKKLESEGGIVEYTPRYAEYVRSNTDDETKLPNSWGQFIWSTDFVGKNDSLPDGYAATVHYGASGLERIEIKKGEETWSSLGRDVQGLPDDVRGFAAKILTQGEQAKEKGVSSWTATLDAPRRVVRLRDLEKAIEVQAESSHVLEIKDENGVTIALQEVGDNPIEVAEPDEKAFEQTRLKLEAIEMTLKELQSTVEKMKTKDK